MDTQSDTRLVSLAVMARLIHVPTRWLRAEADAGRIPALRAGDRYVFVPQVVEATVAQRIREQARRHPHAEGQP